MLKYPAFWRHNPQPYRYPIPFPQYIHNICVACYEEKDDCNRRYPPGAAIEKHYHQPPYFITSSNPQQDYYETPEIGRLPFIIAEHHCFAQFAMTENFDFQLYDLQPEGTKLTYEKTLFYKNFLITKWTKESALHINNAVEWETYRFFSNLWGPSPYAEWKWNQWLNQGRHNNGQPLKYDQANPLRVRKSRTSHELPRQIFSRMDFEQVIFKLNNLLTGK